MGKNKLRRFAENETFACLVQPAFDEIFHRDHPLKGRWREDFFQNDHPVCLELGCGRGEYTVALGQRHPGINCIGIDIKGARMWRGAKTATEYGLSNVGFLRTRIEFIDSFFAPGEVDELWITFPDPQLKKGREKKRLTAPGFLSLYARFLKSGGVVHLKTDSRPLHEYTRSVITCNALPVEECNADIYGTGLADETLSVRTAYESRYLAEGLPITYIRFRLDGKTTFVAPDPEDDTSDPQENAKKTT
jgi:tRNA (guanine-N7-)-methyltransferase